MRHTIKDEDAIRMAAMAYRILRKRNVYFLYIKMFYDKNVTALRDALVEQSLLDRKRYDGDIVPMMCVMIQKLDKCNILKTNPMLYPISHNANKYTNNGLAYAVFVYATWLTQVNCYIRQGVAWENIPRYLLNVA